MNFLQVQILVAGQLSAFGEDVEKRTHDLGIELRSRMFHELGRGLVRTPPVPIRPNRRHCIIGIYDSQDSCGQGDVFAHEAAGIASTIDPFVVIADDLVQIVGLQERLDDGDASSRM